LDNYPFYVMITLTGFPQILEPNVPSINDVTAAIKTIADRWGYKRTLWRYDPILLTDITDIEFHKKNFAYLASRLSGFTERVIVSVYDEYAGARRRLSVLEKNGLCRIYPHYTQEGNLLPEVRDLLADLAVIAKSNGMEMRSCAEKEDLGDLGIKAGACIDGSLIDEITRGTAEKSAAVYGRDKNQRPYCHCVSSVDIGVYGSCPAGCVYCYARR
ncbi:MAG: DUF1848 domain-containing protein, partial [Treponema sp.]|nr:DUF1848 domain-containing protein [Treponema sp.]